MTDARELAATVTPFNMHTDMVIAPDPHGGGLNLTAEDSSGASMSVTITPAMAERLGETAGLSGPPAADPHAVPPASPYNMHTDAKTKIDANGSGSVITVSGPASGPDGKVTLQLSIDGPALQTVKG